MQLLSRMGLIQRLFLQMEIFPIFYLYVIVCSAALNFTACVRTREFVKYTNRSFNERFAEHGNVIVSKT